jgi:hypothetical protein
MSMTVDSIFDRGRRLENIVDEEHTEDVLVPVFTSIPAATRDPNSHPSTRPNTRPKSIPAAVPVPVPTPTASSSVPADNCPCEKLLIILKTSASYLQWCVAVVMQHVMMDTGRRAIQIDSSS